MLANLYHNDAILQDNIPRYFQRDSTFLIWYQHDEDVSSAMNSSASQVPAIKIISCIKQKQITFH